MAGLAVSRNSQWDRLVFARTVLRDEAEAVLLAASRLDETFLMLVEVLAACTGRIAVSGVGKSADVGQKIVGTLNSTGTRSYLLDATRARHGDLGAVHPDDVVLLLSHSGESEELVRLFAPLRPLASAVVAVTGKANSTLARQADVALVYGPIVEACPLSLAPSSSTTVMIALGDAIAFTLSEQRQFTPHDFARFHPAGSLGFKLSSVTTVMRRGHELRLAPASHSVRTVFATARHKGRRTGAVILTNPDGTLAGLFTDSDLARLFEFRSDDGFDQPISQVMTKNPLTLHETATMGEAVELMSLRKISELPIVNSEGVPVGLLDITDIIGQETHEESAPPPILKLVEPATA